MNITIKRLMSLFAAIGLLSLIAYAGDPSRKGTAGAQELLIPVGGQGVALGGSNVAYTTGAEAIYYNPAGLARAESGVDVLFSRTSYFADIGINYGAVGIQAGGIGSLGFSLKSVSFGNIPVTTEDFPDGTGETYSPTYVVAGLTYSRLLSDRISIGANFNLISEKIMSTSASGFAFDAGVEYYGLGIPELKLGVTLKNVGGNMTYDGTDLLRQGTTVGDIRGTQWYKVQAASFELPSKMEIALAYDKKLDEMNEIAISGDFENNNYSDDIWKVGAEYTFQNMFFVRGGYNLDPNAGKDIAGTSMALFDYTFGVGVHADLGGVVATIDYAYRHAVFMDANNVFSVKFGF